MGTSHYKGNSDYLLEEEDGSFVIKPIALDIVWGRSPNYWRLPESENDTAELLGVNWFEVSGSIELNKLKHRKYKIGFIVSLQANGSGWSNNPIYMMTKVGRNDFKWKGVDLSGRDPNTQFDIPEDHTFELTVAEVESNENLNFGLYEVWRGSWKTGLVIHKVVISPL
ncbi:protein PHLOEM PROTEIN 2-LIKE A9-like [Magnolia sinica]|uniref:protein PHLOEM PROTEIN 2-LIKE A9-like n=1 Tax=Magnolia sinica TaxID=86752 RepID=UPI00265B3396|nr:protein PHLOEM PROTEIN 2-LIKE A9-like [Magnolia sinica]